MSLGLPSGTSGKEPACQCRRHKRHGFDTWVGKILRKRKWQPSPVFLPGKSHGQTSLAGYSKLSCKELDTTEAAEYIMRNAGLEEPQARIKIAGRNNNNLRYADNTTLMAKSEEELKSLLMKVNEESEKVGLKLNIQKIKIMASDPITSWEIDGETVETVSDFILGGSKITAEGDCSHEIKRRLLLGRKVMTNQDSIFKAETLLCQQMSI